MSSRTREASVNGAESQDTLQQIKQLVDIWTNLPIHDFARHDITWGVTQASSRITDNGMHRIAEISLIADTEITAQTLGYTHVTIAMSGMSNNLPEKFPLQIISNLTDEKMNTVVVSQTLSSPSSAVAVISRRNGDHFDDSVLEVNPMMSRMQVVHLGNPDGLRQTNDVTQLVLAARKICLNSFSLVENQLRPQK